MKENLQCTSKYGHLRILQDICHVRMTDIEGFLTIYGHSDNLLNSKTLKVKGFTIRRILTALDENRKFGYVKQKIYVTKNCPIFHFAIHVIVRCLEYSIIRRGG